MRRSAQANLHTTRIYTFLPGEYFPIEIIVFIKKKQNYRTLECNLGSCLKNIHELLDNSYNLRDQK